MLNSPLQSSISPTARYYRRSSSNLSSNRGKNPIWGEKRLHAACHSRTRPHPTDNMIVDKRKRFQDFRQLSRSFVGVVSVVRMLVRNSVFCAAADMRTTEIQVSTFCLRCFAGEDLFDKLVQDDAALPRRIEVQSPIAEHPDEPRRAEAPVLLCLQMVDGHVALRLAPRGMGTRRSRRRSLSNISARQRSSSPELPGP